MEAILVLASSIDDMLDMILGEGLPTPTEKIIAKYPNLFI